MFQSKEIYLFIERLHWRWFISDLKYSTKQYMKQYSENILETQKHSPDCKDSKTVDEMDEIDIDNVVSWFFHNFLCP